MAVLALVALIPVAGIAAITVGRVRDAQALGTAASRTAALSREAVELAHLDAALVDEMNFRSMEVVVGGIGVSAAVLAEFIGTDPTTLLPGAQARVDRHAASLRTWFIGFPFIYYF